MGATKRAAVSSMSGVTSKSRKERRKEDKKLKKMRRIAFSTRRPVEKIIRETMGMSEESKKKKKRRKKKTDGTKNSHNESAASMEKVFAEMKQAERVRNKEALKEDDAEIRRLSKMLGYNKRKSKNMPSIFGLEGLDYILEICDEKKRRELAEADEDEMKEKEASSDEEMQDDSDAEFGGLNDGESGASEDDEPFESDDDTAKPNEDEDVDVEDEENDEALETSKPKMKMDIYGRMVDDRTGRLIERDPLAARKKCEDLESEIGGEERARIEKTVTGCINRLGEATLVKSCKTIQELHLANSKNEVKRALTQSLLRIHRSTFRLQPKLSLVYASFVALLHSTVSVEISAFFVEDLLKEFVQLTDSTTPTDDKAAENLGELIANLANFKVIRTQVILELLERLYGHGDSARLFLCLLIIRQSFRALKRTVANELNDFLTKASQFKEDGANAHVRFLIEELVALRRGAPVQMDYELFEHHFNMYNGLLKKSGKKETELGMSLDDILHVDERGRWWVVGSAFVKNDRSIAINDEPSTSGVPSYNNDLLELAKKAKMNTELRRNIFCSIVGANSEDDAFEHLLKLRLSGQNEREIIHILVLLALKEKNFNEFYPAIIRRLCGYHRRFIVTAQYALWDRLRESQTATEKAQHHLGALLHQLVYHRALPLLVLKVVEFAALRSGEARVLKTLFSLLEAACETRLQKIFTPLLGDSKNKSLTDGIRLFLQLHFPQSKAFIYVENLFATHE